MISCEPLALTTADETKLRDWLDQVGAQLAVRVVAAKAKVIICDATEKAIQASDANQFGSAANIGMINVRRYATFISVLEELRQQKEPYTTVKLT